MAKVKCMVGTMHHLTILKTGQEYLRELKEKL